LHAVSREEEGVALKGARMQLIHVFAILLLVAIVAGIFVPWDPRAGKERTADGADADISEPTST
jgi:hypothetical protein